MIETIQYENLKWHHISNPSEEDYRFLLETYNFHPLDIEDCRGTNQRPKIDEYDDYYFLILHFPYFDKGNKFIRIKEVKIFWGKDYIITIGKSHWVVKRLFDTCKEELDSGGEPDSMVMKSSDILLYNLLDRLMVETYTLILRIGAEVDLINYDIFNKKAQKIIELISITRRNIILLNTTFKPQLRLFHQFESGGIKGFVNHEELDMEDYQGNAVVNYTDIEVPYTRIIEHKHFEFKKDGKTVISKEYSTEWKPGGEPYYPVNNQKNDALFNEYKKLAQKENSVLFGGRLGNYKYYDMDKTIEQALILVEQEFGKNA